MKKWEYYTLNVVGNEIKFWDDIEKKLEIFERKEGRKVLNRLGALGWELVAVQSETDMKLEPEWGLGNSKLFTYSHFIFKRELEN